MLPDLLLPIVWSERTESRRFGRRKLVLREARPPLTIADATQAVDSLVRRGFVDVREVSDREYAPPLHPFDLGRPLIEAEVRAVLANPENWRYPADAPDREFTHWVDITDSGLTAYRQRIGGEPS